MLRRMKWSQLERYYLLRALALRRMPRAFDRAVPDAAAAPPVFAQHAPGPVYLGGKLDRVVAGGYRSLDTADLAAWSAGRAQAEAALMLTFDDGLRRFQDVTFPLLRARRLKSVLFVCAGLIELASGPASPLRDYVRASILTWDELKAMQDTGLLDVQSHGLWHHMVPIAPEVLRYDATPPATVIESQELLPADCGLGAFFTGAPAAVPRRRGRPFFLTHPEQSPAASEAAQQADLAEARALIEARLPGSAVRAFAFPWWNGTDAARRAAYRAGYTQVYEGARSLRRAPQRERFTREPIGRLSFDFIDCLPGAGQRGVFALMRAKQRGEYGCDVD